MIVLPLVCMGRVYNHCHWFGDTIIGSFVGYTFLCLCYSKDNYSYFAKPIFEFIFNY